MHNFKARTARPPRYVQPPSVADTDAAIVIPALNEADNLGALLDDCRAQALPASEVVVIDAGSTDGTGDLLAERAGEWPSLRVVTAPGANPSAARNAGINAARSPIVATVDAGSRIGPGWLGAMVDAVRGAGSPCLAVGTVSPDPRSSFEQAVGWFTVRAFKPVDRAGPIGPAFRPPGRNGYCFTKEAWRAAGGYPAELPWSEDKTFVERMRSIGCDVVLARDAVVRWRPRGSLGAVYRQYENYGRGDAMGRIDRQNEVVTLGLYASALLLAVLAVLGSVLAAGLLAAAAVAYLALFTVPAIGALPSRAVVWLPLVRLTVDLAKMRGFLSQTLFGRARGRGG
jgi:glycosyltransferase involved in cell wall biosynthesis